MSIYVMLTSLTDEGRKTIKHNPDRIKHVNKLLFTIKILLCIGSIGFFILWFSNLKNHDYYVISLYIFPLFILLTFFEVIQRDVAGKWVTIGIYIILGGLLVQNVILH